MRCDFIFKSWKNTTLQFNTQGGCETQKTINFVINCVHLLFITALSFCLSISTAATYIFHCSYMYCYYNYSRTLCTKCWVSTHRFNKISLHCGYHWFEVERGVWGGERRPKDKVTWRISLLYIWFYKIGQLWSSAALAGGKLLVSHNQDMILDLKR